MEDAASANHLGGVDLGVERYRILVSKSLDSLGPHSVSRRHSHQISVDDEDPAAQSPADADAASSDRVKDRLDIGGRAADGAENLGGRSLLLEGFGQVAVARLQFLEQPDVFDRDHRLVGKDLEERDLFPGEAASLP